MTFGLIIEGLRRALPRTLLVAGLSLVPVLAARAGDAPVAVVPTVVIYPGQFIDTSKLSEVDVTNPNVRSDYVHDISQLEGMVATRTLLPGRVIPSSSFRLPYAVERGKQVRLVYSDGDLTITAPGMPLQNAAVGDLIRVRNIESGITVSGTVAADDTVQVAGR